MLQQVIETEGFLSSSFFLLPGDLQIRWLIEKFKMRRSISDFFYYDEVFRPNPVLRNRLHAALGFVIQLDAAPIISTDILETRDSDALIGKISAYHADVKNAGFDVTRDELMAAMLHDPAYVNAARHNKDIIIISAFHGNEEALKLLDAKNTEKLFRLLSSVPDVGKVFFEKCINLLKDDSSVDITREAFYACLRYQRADKALEIINKYQIKWLPDEDRIFLSVAFWILFDGGQTQEGFTLFKEVLKRVTSETPIMEIMAMFDLERLGDTKFKEIFGDMLYNTYRNKFNLNDASSSSDVTLALELSIIAENAKSVKNILDNYENKINESFLRGMHYYFPGKYDDIHKDHPKMQIMLSLISRGLIPEQEIKRCAESIKQVDENCSQALLDAVSNVQDKSLSPRRRI